MKRLSVLLAFTLLTSSISVFAQTTPKAAPKSVVKKECAKGSSCCAGEAKTVKAAPRATVKKS